MAREAQKKEEDIRTKINAWLDMAATAGRRFSLEQIRAYEEAGRQAREQRAAIREAKPARGVSELVFARVAPREPRQAMLRHMTKEAIEAALDLGERFDRAKNEKELRLDEWAKAGRG